LSFEEKFEPEIEIFPDRLLSSETAEKLIARLRRIKNVVGVFVHGMSYYNSDEFAVSRIIVRVAKQEYVDEVAERIKEVCRSMLPFSFKLRVGRFTKTRPTVSDYLRADALRKILEEEREE